MFVWPTVRGWLVAVAGVAWLLVAMVNRTVFPFFLACAALALLGASLMAAVLSLRGIRVRRGVAGDATTGETVDVPLIVSNLAGRRRQPLVLVETLPFAADPTVCTVVPPLRPQEERVVARRILALRRGEFRLDRLVVRGGDPAGLFRRQRRLRLPSAMLVYPGCEPISDLLLHPSESLGAVAGSPISATGMSQEFYGVREYHPTDGLRHIHWKSSARFGRLMVREFERNAVVSVAVLVEANEHFVSGPDHWSNLETIIRAAASVCRHCSGLYGTFGLAASGAAPVLVRPRAAAETQAEIMQALATLRAGRGSLMDTALALMRELPRDSVVFCFSLSSSVDLRNLLRAVAEGGMDVRWYCAPREAFAQGRGGRAAAVAAKAPSSGGLHPIELRPGVALAQALVPFHV